MYIEVSSNSNMVLTGKNRAWKINERKCKRKGLAVIGFGLFLERRLDE